MPRWIKSLSLALLVAVQAPALVGCKNKSMIPGTEIPDTEENREILQVLERFRTAFVRQDTAAIVATAHPTYYDESGTDDPGDDVVYEELGPLLNRRLAQVDSVRFTVEYLDVFVRNERATVHVWVDASFHMKPILKEDGTPRLQPRFARKQDYAKFELLRDGDSWRITKGI
ncbi:MAG TPA: hypothetical protein PKW35_19150 [Nannocystaceae bacterium]|nr:hypothetical protein [Nannocystaceae bacterium]